METEKEKTKPRTIDIKNGGFYGHPASPAHGLIAIHRRIIKQRLLNKYTFSGGQLHQQRLEVLKAVEGQRKKRLKDSTSGKRTGFFNRVFGRQKTG